MESLLPALACIAVLLLPGLAVLPWLPRRADDPWAFLADAAGLSIALSALLGMVFWVIGVPPGGWGLAAFGAASLLSIVAASLKGLLPAFRRADLPVWLCGLVVLGGVLALRLYQARGLVFPNWVDSVHHTLIVRKMVEYGGLPSDLRPYLDAPFYYHYGFHLLAAAVAALARIAPDQAVLALGHAVGLLVPLAVYRLGRAAGLNRTAALVAALLPGFILQMPGYYVSWGRYTLLTGLALLPAAMAEVLSLVGNQPSGRPALARALRLVLLSAGLCLTHYLALLLFLLFLVVIAMEGLLPALRKRDLNELPWLVAAASGAGALLALPWLAGMLAFNASSIAIGEPRAAYNPGDFKGFVDMLRPDQSLAMMALAGCCLPLALLRPGVRRIAWWGLLLLFFSMPFAPQLGPFRPDLFTICLFMPAGVLLGWGLVGGAEALASIVTRPFQVLSTVPPVNRETGMSDPPRTRLPGWLSPLILSRIFFLPVVALLLFWGVSKTRTLINQATVIADGTDRRALEWVDVNTPADARFYINSTPWQGDVMRGVDGGYWLMPFTGRYSLVPPVPYVWQVESAWRAVNNWAKRSQALKGCTPDFWAIVREAGLTYVYARQGKGSLRPEILDQCPRLKAVYKDEGVTIYIILQP